MELIKMIGKLNAQLIVPKKKTVVRKKTPARKTEKWIITRTYPKKQQKDLWAQKDAIKKRIRQGSYIDRASNKINLKYNLVDNTDHNDNIRTYPIIPISLDEFRRHEVNISKNAKFGSSFMNLFRKRLLTMNKKTQKASIVINVVISTGINVISTGIKSSRDEFQIPNRSVLKQSRDNNEVKKTYGPYVVQIPDNISKIDTYKFMLYTLLLKNFTTQSSDYIKMLGGSKIVYEKS